MFLTSALMLEELGHVAEARALEKAVAQAVADEQCTRDIGGSLGTADAAKAVADRIQL